MKRKSIILGLLIAASLLLVIGCDTGGSDGGGDTYAIGDTGPAGGQIFYIDEADEHSWTYLEVAPVSTQWVSKVWGGSGEPIIGADGTAIGTGKQNTIDIVAEYGDAEPHDSKIDYAAKLCSDLVCGGYDDWFLPSKDELHAIRNNLVYDAAGKENFSEGFNLLFSYWSSSQSDNKYNAWVEMFFVPIQVDTNKTNTSYVRAVRAF